ncbi:MAG: TIM barrel protein [Pseudomonadota bacterium]
MQPLSPGQRPNAPRYAARLNAFKIGLPGKPTIEDMLRGAASVEGLNAADLNYPDHFETHTARDVASVLDGLGIALNGLAMRYYTDPGFRLGAFTHPDRAVRQNAIDLTRRGIDTLSEMGGDLMTLWMGQDGFDYAFQGNYRQMWDDTIDAIQAVCAHNRSVQIAIEYKPNEPRAYALMPDIGTTLLAVKEAGSPNLGVTLDFAHVLYADEMPAHTAHLIERHSKILGVHLNDGYGKRDDGLMVGSVHPIQTVELFVELARAGYAGAIYFDTFPDHGGLDPCEEARANIAATDRLRAVAEGLMDNVDLAQAIAAQNAAASHTIISRALFGAG